MPSSATPSTPRTICLMARRRKQDRSCACPAWLDSLRAIAEGGPDAFYSGPIAEAIVNSLQQQGGVMTLDDLRKPPLDLGRTDPH